MEMKTREELPFLLPVGRLVRSTRYKEGEFLTVFSSEPQSLMIEEKEDWEDAKEREMRFLSPRLPPPRLIYHTPVTPSVPAVHSYLDMLPGTSNNPFVSIYCNADRPRSELTFGFVRFSERRYIIRNDSDADAIGEFSNANTTSSSSAVFDGGTKRDNELFPSRS